MSKPIVGIYNFDAETSHLLYISLLAMAVTITPKMLGYLPLVGILRAGGDTVFCMPEQVEGLNLTEENYRDTISAKEYAFLRPLNGGYSKWITDKVTIFTIFKPFRQCMPMCWYQISKRYQETQIIPLYDFDAGDTMVMADMEAKRKLKAERAKQKVLK